MPGRRDHEQVMPGVQRAPDGLREHRAERVHVEHAPDAAVHEAPRGALLLAEVARPLCGGAAGDAAQREAVPRVREEDDGVVEVVGARLVDVDVAGAAAVAGELGPADVAGMVGIAAVLSPQKRVLWMGEEVSSVARCHASTKTWTAGLKLMTRGS